MTSQLGRRLIYSVGALAGRLAGQDWGTATRLVQGLYLTAHLVGKRLLDGRELRALADLAQPGMVVCDVGANVGITTVAFAQRVGPLGRVLAFEPEPFNAAVFRRHLERAPFQTVTLFEMGLDERAGMRQLHVNRACRADSRIVPGGATPPPGTLNVPCDSLDSVLERLNVSRVDLIKIDVQGFEPFVLRGMRRTLANNPGIQVVLELYPEGLGEHGHNAQSLLATLFETFPAVERWNGSGWSRMDRGLARQQAVGSGPLPYFDLWCHS